MLGSLFCFLYTYHHLPALGSLSDWLSGIGTTGTVFFAWKNIYDREVPKLEISCMDLNDTKKITITNKSNFAVTLTEIEISSDDPNGYRDAVSLPAPNLPGPKLKEYKENIPFPVDRNKNKINNSTGGIILDIYNNSYIIDVESNCFDLSDKIQVRDSSGYKYVIRSRKIKRAIKKELWSDSKLILRRK